MLLCPVSGKIKKRFLCGVCTLRGNGVARTTDDEQQRPMTPDEIIQEEFYVRADTDLN